MIIATFNSASSRRRFEERWPNDTLGSAAAYCLRIRGSRSPMSA